ncbi:hypothetical protein ABT010_07595 [Streptomyces sp. NPDC002668]|uniref:hypothetical protein n=1 Tax=Streptomyces sp. NPDC002668 TaxID=3154422 RepID=UPI00332CC0CE
MTEDAGGVPSVGAAVHDTVRDRVGRVMGHVGPYVQLRPLAGGIEWDADPNHLRLLTPAELRSALVAEANARSRQPR